MAPKKIEQTALELALKNAKYQEELIESLQKKIDEIVKERDHLREELKIAESRIPSIAQIVSEDIIEPKKKNTMNRFIT